MPDIHIGTHGAARMSIHLHGVFVVLIILILYGRRLSDPGFRPPNVGLADALTIEYLKLVGGNSMEDLQGVCRCCP